MTRILGDLKFEWNEENSAALIEEVNTFEGDLHEASLDKRVKGHKEYLKEFFFVDEVETEVLEDKSGQKKVKFSLVSRDSKSQIMLDISLYYGELLLEERTEEEKQNAREMYNKTLFDEDPDEE